MYSSLFKLILLLLTCLTGLALAGPIKGKNLSIVTKRVRIPRHLRSSLVHTQKFSRRGVEDTFEPETDSAFAKQLSEKKATEAANLFSEDEEIISTKDRKSSEDKETIVAADDTPNKYKEDVDSARDTYSSDKETVITADNELSNDSEAVNVADDEFITDKKVASAVNEAVNNDKEAISEADINTGKSSAAASNKLGAKKKAQLDDDEIDAAFDAPFDSNMNPGKELVNKYKFHFEDTEPLSDGIEFLRDQHEEGLQEEAEAAAEEAEEEEAERRAASLRAQTAQRVRSAVDEMP
jgi:hypothetical protein